MALVVREIVEYFELELRVYLIQSIPVLSYVEQQMAAISSNIKLQQMLATL